MRGTPSTTAIVAGTAPPAADAVLDLARDPQVVGPGEAVADDRGLEGDHGAAGRRARRRPRGGSSGACRHAIAVASGRRAASRLPARPGHYGGAVTTGPEPRRPRTRPLGGRRPCARRPHRAHPADPPRRRRASRGLPPLAVGRDGLLPLLRALPRAHRARRPPVHPRRPRRPGGARRDGGRRDRRCRPLRPDRRARRRGRVRRPRRPPGPRARIGPARAPRRRRARARRTALRRRGAADQPADARDVRGGRLPPERTSSRTASSCWPSTSSPRSRRSPCAPRASTAPRRSASRGSSRPTRSSSSVPAATRHRSAIACCTTWSSGGFTGRVYAVNRAAAADRAQVLERADVRLGARASPEPVTSRWWRCRPTRCSAVVDECGALGRRWAARRARAASPRAAPTGWRVSGRSYAGPAGSACASSGRTRSASSTPTRPSRSTRRWRP